MSWTAAQPAGEGAGELAALEARRQRLDQVELPVDVGFVAVEDDGTGEHLGDQLQPGSYGRGRVVGRGQGFEEPHVALAVRQHEIGEGAAGIDPETVLGAHASLPYSAAAATRRSRSVAAMSTSSVVSSVITTP